MTRFLTKKRVMIVASVAASAILAAVAYAYWTVGGSGSGSATTTTDTDNLAITQTALTDLVPGDSPNVDVNIDNPNSYSVFVSTVTPSLAVSNAYDATTNPTGCKLSDFTMDPIVVDQQIAATDDLDVDGTLNFADTALNQDGCKTQTVTITYSSN